MIQRLGLRIDGVRRAWAALALLALWCSATPTVRADIDGLEQADRVLSMASCTADLRARRGAPLDSAELTSPGCAFFRYAVDDLQVEGFAVAPVDPGPHPVVIFNRGGTADFGRVGVGLLAELPAMLADAGFFVIGSQYRGGTDAPAEVEGTDEWGGGDVDDVLALLDIIDSMDIADGARIGMFGASRGAVNMLVAARRSDRFDAVVGFSGLYDLAAEAERRPRMAAIWARHMPDHAEDPEAALSRRSVVDWVDELPTGVPILILHGALDERASAHGALKLANELQDAFSRYKLVIYDGDDHGLTANRDAAFLQAVAWFRRHLGPAP